MKPLACAYKEKFGHDQCWESHQIFTTGACSKYAFICSATAEVAVQAAIRETENRLRIVYTQQRLVECPMENPPGIVCSSCNAQMMSSDNFCSNCGNSLRAMPPATSVSRQIVVYLISFFLAPFGLWYAWKYLKQDDHTSKIIGAVAIALTIVSITVTIWLAAGLFNSVNRYLNLLRDSSFQ
jgi:hypothetical protein